MTVQFVSNGANVNAGFAAVFKTSKDNNREYKLNNNQNGILIYLVYTGNDTCSFYCKNGGTCVNGNPPNCMCASGYAGTQCEADLYCNQNPCLNGGTCSHNTNNTDYVCQCASNFTGHNCETRKNLFLFSI